MIFEDKQITLKDGRTAILKSPCVEDADKMLHYIKNACSETDFLVRYPEEWNSVSVASEEKWIRNLRKSQNALAITCCVDSKIAGNCEINFRGGLKTSHKATVAIAILKEYWNLGIGSAMFAELISVAETRPEIQIIELEFIEGNDRAKALYEKYGFKIVGERPNAFKIKDGSLLKEYFMQKEIIKK
ncbi:MAG: GNAT family N-acetyltransferase [Candidatus Borkfalkiaceae bacterium]|nr:GNAT family N-acetyltransferase [Christensenellaceae bacterium]